MQYFILQNNWTQYYVYKLLSEFNNVYNTILFIFTSLNYTILTVRLNGPSTLGSITVFLSVYINVEHIWARKHITHFINITLLCTCNSTSVRIIAIIVLDDL